MGKLPLTPSFSWHRYRLVLKGGLLVPVPVLSTPGTPAVPILLMMSLHVHNLGRDQILNIQLSLLPQPWLRL